MDYSQLTTCSASEVAATRQGLLRHDTDAKIESNVTDTHGDSIAGVAFCGRIEFRLMARFKRDRRDAPLPPRTSRSRQARL